MEELSERDPRADRQTRRMWWIMGGMISLLLAMVVWLFVFHDGPSPEDSLNLPRWSDRGGKNNPLVVFCREVAAGNIDDYLALPIEVGRLERGTETAMQEFIEKHRSCFVAFDRLMMTQRSGWQWSGGKDAIEYRSGRGDASSCYSYSEAARMKMHLLCVNGESDKAVNLALQGFQFGRGLQEAEGASHHVILGGGIQWTATVGLREALTATEAKAEILQSCLDELEKLEGPGRGDCQFALRADYLQFKNWLDDPDGLHKYMPPGWRLSFKPNQTLEMYLEQDRPVIAALGREWRDALSASRSSKGILDDLRARSRNVLTYFENNFGGKTLLGQWSSGSLGFIEKAISYVALNRQMRIMLAMRLFELRERRLPHGLDELVPTFLAMVPKDPFSASLMRWNSVENIIYSLGTNGKDDGGSVHDEDPFVSADLGMHYWWTGTPIDQSPK